MADKQDYNRHNREYDEEQQKQHFQSWETFWGRPGYGAPREVLRPNIYNNDCEYSDKQKQNLATIAPKKILWGKILLLIPGDIWSWKTNSVLDT